MKCFLILEIGLSLLRNHVKPGLYAHACRTSVVAVKESSISLTSHMFIMYQPESRIGYYIRTTLISFFNTNKRVLDCKRVI